MLLKTKPIHEIYRPSLYESQKKEIVTTFLKIVPLGESATSEAIGDAICKVLKDSGLTLDRLIGIGVDGCSTMVGVHHSLATYFCELIPHIIIFRCVCHSLQLAASKAADTLPAKVLHCQATCQYVPRSKELRHVDLPGGNVEGLFQNQQAV